VGLRHQGGLLLVGDVPGGAHQAAQLAEAQRELPAATGAALALAEDLGHGHAVELGDLAVALDLLGDEPDDLPAVLVGVVHVVVHVHLVPVAADAAAEGGVHAGVEGVALVLLDGVEVARRHQDEVAGHGLGLDHGPAAALALAHDGELLLLERGEQALLALHAQHVDLVHEQDAAVGLVDGPGLDALVGRGLQPAGLEGVVAHVAQQAAGVGAGRIHEGRLVLGGVADQQLGHQRGLAHAHLPHDHHQHGRGDDADDEDGGVAGVDVGDDGEGGDGQHDEQLEGGLALLLAVGLGLLGRDDLLALAGRDDADAGLVGVLQVGVGDDVLEVLRREELGHGLGQHRLPRAGVADHHDVALLLGGLLDDLDGLLLADDLVDEAVRDLQVARAAEVLFQDPLVHGLQGGGLRGHWGHSGSENGTFVGASQDDVRGGGLGLWDFPIKALWTRTWATGVVRRAG
jgi:hypothetical protein